MKILAPANSEKEVKRIIDAGADEIYCGVIPREWMTEYTNVASCNRREWQTANLSSFGELGKLADIAHSHDRPVYLTLNALYTEQQYPLIMKQIESAMSIGIDALIIADIGLLHKLTTEKLGMDIHISTGGTTFNSETARFYGDFGIKRINLPRHLTVSEIRQIATNNPNIKFDVFILNSGCKNIDGFCTFQLGINERLHKGIWNIPKKMNIDRHLLDALRMLPPSVAQSIYGDVFGVDSACLLNYDVSFLHDGSHFDSKTKQSICRHLSTGFSLFSGIDTCGACSIPQLKEAGVFAIKIVGRNYSTGKKVKDVRFLKEVLNHLGEESADIEEFPKYVKRLFKRIYRLPCRELCYYPEGK